jgi:hypothetical protein
MRTSSEWIEYRKYGFLWDNEITKLLADFVSVEAERDEWKAKGEKLAEAVGRVQGMLDAVDPSSRAAVEIQTICDAALEEWRKE